MIKKSLHLPYNIKFNLRLPNKNSSKLSIIDSFVNARRAKKGSKTSRFFRHLFEHKNIKRVLGTNLAFITIATSFFPIHSIRAQESDIKPNTEDVVVKTTISRRSPVEKVKVTQNYHLFHRGIDLDGKTGDPIYPYKKGVVVETQYSNYGYGNVIYIKHSDDTISLYAHLSRIQVYKGEVVNTDTKIGEIGATGRAFGDHLHLEIYQNGIPVNPTHILPDY